LTDIGAPDYSKRPFKVKDADAAVRQTAHVRESIESRTENAEGLMNGLSRLSKILRAGRRSPSAETIQDALDVYDIDVAPHAPSSRVRMPSLKEVRADLAMLQGAGGEGKFEEALGSLDGLYGKLESLVGVWSEQLEAWAARRHLMLAVRNMASKDPGVVRELAASEVARELVRAARELVGARDKSASL